MSVREYIGARYLPLFPDDPQWSSANTYEPLTVVQNLGSSYISRQYVPAGIQISNTDYWVLWADFNSQIEQYRAEVQTFDGRITANANDIDALENIIPKSAFSTSSTVKNAIDGLRTDVDNIDSGLVWAFRNKKIVVFSDSTFQSNTDPDTQTATKSVISYIRDMSGATVVNKGASGTSTDYLYNLVSSMSASEIADADVVIVAYGTNDWQASRPLIQLNTTQSTTFEQLYRGSLKQIKLKAPRASIICVTPAYVHSTQANAFGILNMNEAGNEIYSYGDVIEHTANNENCACVRLDRLLAIDENNYRYKMLESRGADYSDIWVHYAETTNEKIANMICSAFFGWNSSSSADKSIDVTPAFVRNNASPKSIYTIGNRQGFTVGTTPLSFPQITLIANAPYYLSFVGGLVNVTVNDVTVASVRNQSVCIIPFSLNTSAPAIIKFERYDSNQAAYITNVRITIGRPNFYDATSDNASVDYEEFTTSNADYKGRIVNGNRSLYMHMSSVALPGATTPIDTIPVANFKSAFYVGTGNGQINGTVTALFGRINNDGTIYIHQPTSGTVSNLRMYFMAVE